MPTRLQVAFQRRIAVQLRAAIARVLAARTADLDEWLSQVVPTVLDAQRGVVATTDAFLSLDAGLATDTDTAPWGIDAERIIGRVARRGVLLEDVYARTLRATVGTTRGRLEREVATDISLARREATWIHTAGDQRIVGHRRVLSAAADHCALCVVASTRVYRSADLAPIHSHCGCTTQPIYRRAEAPTVDQAFLEDLYSRAGTNRYEDLRTLRVLTDELPPGVTPAALPEAVAVTETPELGPTLVAA